MGEDIKRTYASNKDLPVEEQLRMTTDRDINVLYSLARRENVDPEVLRILSQNETWQLRQVVACHPLLPDDARAALARDPNEYVRRDAQAWQRMDEDRPRITRAWAQPEND